MVKTRNQTAQLALATQTATDEENPDPSWQQETQRLQSELSSIRSDIARMDSKIDEKISDMRTSILGELQKLIAIALGKASMTEAAPIPAPHPQGLVGVQIPTSGVLGSPPGVQATTSNTSNEPVVIEDTIRLAPELAPPQGDRFAPEGFEDPFSELVDLQQTDSADQFYEEFVVLLNQVRLPDDYVLSMFKNHLRLEISQFLKLLKPRNLTEAFHMAKHLESIFFPAPKKGYSSSARAVTPSVLAIPPRGLGSSMKSLPSVMSSAYTSRSVTPAVLSPSSSKTPPGGNTKGVGKNLTSAEIDDRKRKGLCFWCAGKYTPGHKCAKSQVFQIVVDGLEDEGELEEFQDCEEVSEVLKPEGPILSLQAMWGMSSWETMRLKISIEGHEWVALLDSGSTHNFLSLTVVKRLNLRVEKRNSLKVIIADGGRLSTLGLCSNVEWKAQDHDTSHEMQQLLNNFGDVFEEPITLPPNRGKEHKIPLLDESSVVKIRPYRYLAYQNDEIEKMTRELLSSGLIRDSTSAFASPVVMVKKKDGAWRMCVDYRRLNQLTMKDKFLIPIIEELLDELGKAMIFSKLDLRSGYHQIRMWEPNIPKTAFRTHEGHYEFVVISFGLTNAPATFQGLMNQLFKGLLRKTVLVFLDDILVYSENFADHLQHLKVVLEILRSNRLYAKRSKCSFGADAVDYLGYIISGGKISMEDSKVKCIQEWPAPNSVKDLRGFLGLSGYYRRFIRGYGGIAKPLTDLLKKGAWKWTYVEHEAFDRLKGALQEAPVLALPDFNEEFNVETDTSTLGVGAVLVQKGKPLAFFSKGLGVRHQGLSIYEKEMLAALLAVKKWSSYLLGRHFKIKTDHQSLKFLTDQQAITTAQQKWVVKMLGYDFEVVYRSGSQNRVADVLSRNPSFGGCQAMVVSVVTSELFNKISDTWRTVSKLKKKITEISNGNSVGVKYTWDGRSLRRKGKLVVGNDIELRRELLNFFHSNNDESIEEAALRESIEEAGVLGNVEVAALNLVLHLLTDLH
ncbi:hypothetical protein GQ457_03G026640 [Hibiscus cannabinus]